jgi:hypothetical protein
MFRKYDLFPSSGDERKAPTRLDLLGTVHKVQNPSNSDSGDERKTPARLDLLGTVHKVQNPSNSECYTPLSESFRC